MGSTISAPEREPQIPEGRLTQLEATGKSQEQPLATPPTATPVLQVFRQLTVADTEDLVNTIQTVFEESASVREDGVLLMNAPHLIPSPESIVLPEESDDFRFEGSAQRVNIPKKLQGKGMVVIENDEAKLPNARPTFSVTEVLSPEMMEAFFREALNSKAKGKKMPYFNIDLAERSCRTDSTFKLKCGMPMDNLSYLAGVTTPYAYFSTGISHFGAHVEDWYFGSFNILFAGATKLWIAVKPSSQKLFESKVRELFPKAGKCVQFMRHQALNIGPWKLREWGIEHYFVPQMPGQIVAVTGHTYHWGLNTGHNYAEAINFCLERDWKAAEDFENCYIGCGLDIEKVIPLPEPVYEDGILEEKMERAAQRHTEKRAEWNLKLAEVQARKDKKSGRAKARELAEKRAAASAVKDTDFGMPDGERPPSRRASHVEVSPLKATPRRNLAKENTGGRQPQIDVIQDHIKVASNEFGLRKRAPPKRTQVQHIASTSRSDSEDEGDESESHVDADSDGDSDGGSEASIAPRARIRPKKGHQSSSSRSSQKSSILSSSDISQQIANGVAAALVPVLAEVQKLFAQQQSLVLKQHEHERQLIGSCQRSELGLAKIHQLLENNLPRVVLSKAGDDRARDAARSSRRTIGTTETVASSSAGASATSSVHEAEAMDVDLAHEVSGSVAQRRVEDPFATKERLQHRPEDRSAVRQVPRTEKSVQSHEDPFRTQQSFASPSHHDSQAQVTQNSPIKPRFENPLATQARLSKEKQTRQAATANPTKQKPGKDLRRSKKASADVGSRSARGSKRNCPTLGEAPPRSSSELEDDSPAYSPITPGHKSLDSTPIEGQTPSSPPTSLSRDSDEDEDEDGDDGDYVANPRKGSGLKSQMQLPQATASTAQGHMLMSQSSKQLSSDVLQDIIKILRKKCNHCGTTSIVGCDKEFPCSDCEKRGINCIYDKPFDRWRAHILEALQQGKSPEDMKPGGGRSYNSIYNAYMRKQGRVDLIDVLTWSEPSGPYKKNQPSNKRAVDEVDDTAAAESSKRPRTEDRQGLEVSLPLPSEKLANVESTSKRAAGTGNRELANLCGTNEATEHFGASLDGSKRASRSRQATVGV